MIDEAQGIDADEAKGAKTISPENKLILQIARVLWMIEQDDKGLAIGSEERKNSWKAGRRDQIKTAKALVRRLGKKGITVAQAELPVAADDEDDE